MEVQAAALSSTTPVPAGRMLPASQTALDHIAALSPNLLGSAVFTASGELIASRGEPLVRESAGRKFWLARSADSTDEIGKFVTKHATIPGGEFFGVRLKDVAMLVLADAGALPSLTLLDMKNVVCDLSRATRAEPVA